VIDTELDREDHESIPCNCNRDGTETTWCQNWPPNQIKLVLKTTKNYGKLYLKKKSFCVFFCCNYMLFSYSMTNVQTQNYYINS
jgi:hypothetical protein